MKYNFLGHNPSRELDFLLEASSSEGSNPVNYDQEIIDLLMAAAHDCAEQAQRPDRWDEMRWDEMDSDQWDG
ncbi:hypothetical protein DFH28DRAFT_1136298 [Melampsora americana]|nr:hypothetical protein DFH28DRAFT_1136298 [Melampsora americana]